MTWTIDKTRPMQTWVQKNGSLVGRVWFMDYGSVKGIVTDETTAIHETLWTFEFRVNDGDRDLRRMQSMVQNVMETRRLAANKPKREPANRCRAGW